MIRGRTVDGLDRWVAAEAQSGRRWSCPDRSVGGYPFRIEIVCASLALERPDVAARLGRTLVVAQIYDPAHLVAEAEGPLIVTGGPDSVEATWRRFQASVVTTRGQQRLAAVADDPRIRVLSPVRGAYEIAATTIEAHMRPDPAEASTVDVALSATGAIVPGLDEWIGGTEPATVELVLAVSRANDLPARPLWAELERWRAAGGRADVSRFRLAKGSRRIEATGRIGIDERHRPEGQLDAAAIGLGGLIGRVAGDRSLLGRGGLLGALLGTPQAEPAPPADGAPRLRPLPPVRLDAGRLYLGPLPVPGVAVPALY